MRLSGFSSNSLWEDSIGSTLRSIDSAREIRIVDVSNQGIILFFVSSRDEEKEDSRFRVIARL